MKLNKKYFLAIFTALGIQLVLGVNLVNAAACEAEVLAVIQSGSESKYEITSYYTTMADFYEVHFKKADEFWPKVKERIENIRRTQTELLEPTIDQLKYGLQKAELALKDGIGDPRDNRLTICLAQSLINSNVNVDAIISGQKANNFKGNQQNKSSSPTSSSNQSSTAAQSNSTESYNLQVSQNNKQNYQAVQRAYEQANAGKGKKHNKEANATECMKNNPAQKSFTNKCSQTINFTYCFSGVPTGAKNENPQTLADLSCQNEQFGTLTIGAGESIPGSYNGLSIQGLPCKSPSQPVDMSFNRATNATTGRCSF